MSQLSTAPTEVRKRASRARSTTTHVASSQLPLPETVRRERVVWLYVITVVAIHLAAATAFIPWLFSWTGLALAVLGVPFYGMGITLGYHRLLAHRSLVVAQVARTRICALCPVLSPGHARQVGHGSPHAPRLLRRTIRPA